MSCQCDRLKPYNLVCRACEATMESDYIRPVPAKAVYGIKLSKTQTRRGQLPPDHDA